MRFWAGMWFITWMILVAVLVVKVDGKKMTSLQIQQCTKGDRG